MAVAHLGDEVQRVLYRPHGYDVKELIGSGSFSEVFKLEHRESGSVIALKTFKHKMNNSLSYRQAVKEIAFLGLFNHPNILAMEMYEVNKVFVYIGTEYAAHGSLRSFLSNDQPILEPVVKFVMQQLLAALTYLHKMGVFHGDVKPENVLCTDLTGNGPTIKLCDFGLSEIKLRGQDSMFFKSGSLFYMAPEVLLKYPVDCTCDLWSAGVIMYVMMFARHIFRTDEKDKKKHISCIRRRVQPSWAGYTEFSYDCNCLVRNLLSYDKYARLTGEMLCNHPFLRIATPVVPTADTFAANAEENMSKASTHAREKTWGEALVVATKAVLEQKIHHNLIDDAVQRDLIQSRWQQFEFFISDVERKLLYPEPELICPDTCGDLEFRKYLASTPKLLDGYDMGCSAEMFLSEGYEKKALDYFQQALDILMPLMGSEPKSSRKNILGKKLQKWMNHFEALRGRLQSSGDAAASSSALGEPGPAFSQPAPTFSQPAPTFSQPAPTFSQPAPTFSQPVHTFHQATHVFNQPGPAFGQSAPTFGQPGSAFRQAGPTLIQPGPAFRQPGPAFSQPRPAFSQPGKTFNRHALAFSQPLPALGQPLPVLGQPIPAFGQPIPALGQPAHILGQPAHILGQPAHVLGQPAHAFSQPALPFRQPLHSFNQLAPPFHQLIPTFPAPVFHQAINPCPHPVTAFHQPATPLHHPGPVLCQQVHEFRQPGPTSHQPTPASRQPAPASHQPPPASHQLVPVSHQPAPASHQPACSGNSCTCEYCPSITYIMYNNETED